MTSYSHVVIFREVKNIDKHEDEPREGKLEKIHFEQENGESDSTNEDESNQLDEEEES
jgi:hypothetical protein